MKIWIISDTHFNHEAIKTAFEFRKDGYELETCRKIKNNVKEEDILIHLGDVIFDRASELKGYIEKMGKCKKILVKGNHDKSSDSFYYDKGFDLVTDRIDIGDYIFTHIPLKNLEKGKLNIHGHNHTNRKHILYYANSSEQYVLYDCIKQNYMPILLNNLIKQSKKKPILKRTWWQRLFGYNGERHN